MKVFIFSPFNNPCCMPFYIYAISIKHLFNKKNIECILTLDEPNIEEKDLFIVFQPFFYQLNKNYNDLILIITESIFSPLKTNIKNILQNNKNNIKLLLDYSYQNINALKKLTKIPIKFCPPMYSPIIENKINNNQEKIYDILFYGGLNDRRKHIINVLKKKYKTITYYSKKQKKNIDEKLYDLMGKSKIIIIIHFYEKDLCYDFYRISFLLSNKVFFIQEDVQQDDKIINLDIPLTNYNDFVNECDKYINMTQEERNQICEKNYQYFKKNFNLENYFIIDELLK